MIANGGRDVKHSYGFPAGTDKAHAIEHAKRQAVQDGYIGGPGDCSAQVIETEAHRSDTDERVIRHGKEELMPHAPEFVVVIREL
jgi:hypothetical protein